jgi:uncharacterized membrane protein YeaQ/YmgE (transglycosylase-associated protein family)
MTLSLGQIIIWISVGGLTGFVAGMALSRRKRNNERVSLDNVLLGLFGAAFLGLALSIMQIQPAILPDVRFNLFDLLVAMFGALVLVYFVRQVSRR